MTLDAELRDFAEELKSRAAAAVAPGWVREEPGTPASEADVFEDVYRRRLLTPEQLEQLPPPEQLVHELFVRNSLATLYGRPGTGKTFIAMAVSFAIVSGTSFFGRRVRQGPVLYIAGEGTAGLAQRQRAWREACGYPSLDGMHWLPIGVDLLTAAKVTALVRIVEEVRPVLIVIDTVARSMPGGDENSSADMGSLVAAADRLREASAACVNLVHHSPRDGSTPRGHSALEGAVDTALLVERNGTEFRMTSHKQKDLPPLEPILFELQRFGTSCVPVLPSGHGSAYDFVESERALRDLMWQSCGSEGLSSSALLRMAEMPERTFYRALKSLRKRDIVKNVGTDKQPRWVAINDGDDGDCHVLPRTATSGAVSTATLPPPYTEVGGGSGGSSSDLQQALDLEAEA